MKKTLLVVLINLLFISPAFADSFYKVDTMTFKRVEVRPGGIVWLQTGWGEPDGNMESLEGAGTWATSNIRITPPAGLENEYLSIVLTAVASGRSLVVLAIGSANAGDVNTSRIQLQ